MKKSLLLVFAAVIVISGCDLIEQVLDLNKPPTISVDGGTEYTIAIDERLSLNASNSQDSDGDLVSFDWAITSFPAGASLSDYFFNSVGGMAEFSGSVTGNFVITLIAYDDLEESTVRINVTVQNAPVADAGEDFNVAVGTTALFDASESSDADGSIVSYLWDFGDASATVILGVPEATHTFVAEGEYTVTLTVTDDDGATAETTVMVSVTAAESLVTIYVLDKSSGESLTGATVSVAGTASQETLTGSTHVVPLPDGDFTIVVEKEGFRAEGIALSVFEDVTVTVDMSPIVPETDTREPVSGAVSAASTALTTPFTVGVSTGRLTEFYQIENGGGDGQFTVNARTGNVVISAMRADANEEIIEIAYIGEQPLASGSPLTNQDLDFSASALRYAGTKDENGDLKVRLDTRALVAEQPAVIADTSFDFDIDLIGANSVTLESTFNNLDTTFFTKTPAGSSGATDMNIGFNLVPTTITANSVTGGYSIGFSAVTNADFYEAYILEATDTGAIITFHAIISGGNALTVPNSAVNTDADAVKAFVAAVSVPSYDEASLLSGTLSLNEYEYAESGTLIVNNGSTVVTPLSISGGDRGFKWLNYRALFGFDLLVMDE